MHLSWELCFHTKVWLKITNKTQVAFWREFYFKVIRTTLIVRFNVVCTLYAYSQHTQKKCFKIFLPLLIPPVISCVASRYITCHCYLIGTLWKNTLKTLFHQLAECSRSIPHTWNVLDWVQAESLCCMSHLCMCFLSASISQCVLFNRGGNANIKKRGSLSPQHQNSLSHPSVWDVHGALTGVDTS